MCLLALARGNKVFHGLSAIAILTFCVATHAMDGQQKIDGLTAILIARHNPTGEITMVSYANADPSTYYITVHRAAKLLIEESKVKPTCLSYSHHQHDAQIAIGYNDGAVRRFKCATDKKELCTYRNTYHLLWQSWVRDVSWRNDNKLLAVASQSEGVGCISTYNAEDGKLQHCIESVVQLACFDPKTNMLCVVGSSPDKLKFWHETGSEISLKQAPFTVNSEYMNISINKTGMLRAYEDDFKGYVQGMCFSKDGRYLLMPVTNRIEEIGGGVTTRINLLFFDTSQKPGDDGYVKPVARAVQETEGSPHVKVLDAPDAQRFVCCVGGLIQLFTHQGDPAGSKIIDTACDFAIVKDTKKSVTVLVAMEKGVLDCIKLSTQVPSLSNVISGLLNAKKSACVCM